MYVDRKFGQQQIMVPKLEGYLNLKKLLDNELGKVTGGDTGGDSLDFVPYCKLNKMQYNPVHGRCDDFEP
ncbi:MAG: hypothetical protein ABFD04_10665, partial [Syntrophomonas sp.]